MEVVVPPSLQWMQQLLHRYLDKDAIASSITCCWDYALKADKLQSEYIQLVHHYSAMIALSRGCAVRLQKRDLIHHKTRL
ncbi:hypothetical protein CEUSTIGMA_g10459.t1 [Chlamydomonas eustigma]|uniref:Uncharacterized protein n=1 Tax=Chlamydomonas eustigma TaxID=1157962 RepID=A0A250XJD8_9CHLO|nr:hypothetical protein CEUSTIGMA_g10459.t1 [Chlamydomonas eustigma]|eukprot:GAX83032.1 hypothetical protein CEUSTIGMA_g10459.t1 [Chlamydomonas eustigma]